MFFSRITVFASQLFLLILFPAALCQSHQSRSVSTPQGIYYPNTTLRDVDQFLGIRYAEPPLGPLRFAAPVPYTSGSPRDEVNATSFGPVCVQDPIFLGSRQTNMSEDCLTLNIFRPHHHHHHNGQRPDRKQQPLLPVMVFIYGGGNYAGQAPPYHAQNLVAHALRNTTTPILAVTLNYRTGGFGLLYNSLFARHRLMNAGLKDQRAALRWLHDNIAAFGGDPDRVVLFGQSAGSFDAWFQARYAARDAPADRLFAGVILESGSPASLVLKGMEPASGDTYLQRTLRAVGCPSATEGAAAGNRALQCLRSVSTESLAAVWFNQTSPLNEGMDDYGQMTIGFGVDGDWLTTPYYWDEKVAQIPMIIGTDLNEGSFSGPVIQGRATNVTYLTEVVAKNLNTTNFSLAAPVVSTYYKHTAAQNGRGYNADPTAPDSYYTGEAVLGDAAHDIPRRVNLGRHSSGADAPAGYDPSRSGRPARTWGFRWSQRPPLSLWDEEFYAFPPDLPDAIKARFGVQHGSELAYIFGDVYGWADATEGDRSLAELVQGMWISFAYELDPNFHGISGVPRWDAYNPLRASIFNFEDQGPTTPGMIPDNMRLDSYNAYRDAIVKVGQPALPAIRA